MKSRAKQLDTERVNFGK